MKKFITNNNFFNYFLFPLILLLLMDLFYKANGIVLEGFTNYAYIDIFISIFKHPIPFIIMYIYLLIFNALLIYIFKNFKLPKIILTLLILILMIVNDFKLAIMQVPIRISDIYYLNASNGNMMLSFMNNVFGFWMIKTLLKTVGIVLMLICVSKLTGKKKIKLKKRIPVIIVCIIMLVLPWININPKLYITYLYPNQKDKSTENDTDITKTYYKYGFLQGVYYYYLKDNDVSTNKYSKKQAIEEIKNSIPSNKNWGQPNVVLILSETLSDANRLKDIEFDKELLKNINNYKDLNRAYSFNLLVPTYGGSSVNSEFEVLTGANLSFFNTGFIPYTQLYNDQNSPYFPNIIKEFNNNGYTTKYITAWGPDSYKSSYVYSKFEVTEKIYNENLVNPTKKGIYISDEYMMDVIYDELKNKEKDEKKFLFVATGQNHSPYSKDRYKKYDVKVKSSNYNKEDTGLLQCYAQGVYDADKQLDRLYKNINKLDEKTIIILFGDHNPYIVNKKGENIYLTDNYFNTGDKNLDYLHTYTTPAVILANYDIDIDDLKYINANYLGSYVVNNLDINVSDYFKYVNSNMFKLPIYARNFVYKDKIIPIDNLSNIDKKTYNNIGNVQYYKFYDYENNK